MNTKDTIIDEARKVFEKFGFNKTSMADIALAARKGRRTLYTYFTNKEEVFKAVIDTEVNNLAERLKEIVYSKMPVDQKLRLYLHTRMKMLRELTVYYSALREDFINNLGLIEGLRREKDKIEEGIIKEMLDEGIRDRLFSIGDTLLISKSIVVAMKGFEMPIFMGDEDYDFDELINPMIELFFKGVMVKQDS
ncbi:MAG: TetR/AcrR family transcriptional regulator [Bacteroidales bacterium]|nr:TetR/AcrR family transcriptional regulator [Bacteroidales bacterium]